MRGNRGDGERAGSEGRSRAVARRAAKRAREREEVGEVHHMVGVDGGNCIGSSVTKLWGSDRLRG